MFCGEGVRILPSETWLAPEERGVPNGADSGQHPYLYYVRWTGANEQQRELVRVPLT